MQPSVFGGFRRLYTVFTPFSRPKLRYFSQCTAVCDEESVRNPKRSPEDSAAPLLWQTMDFHAEFKSQANTSFETLLRRQQRLRTLRLAASHLFDGHSIAVISASFAAAVALGAAEALLWLEPVATLEESIAFVRRYSLGNVLPSMVWSVQPADVVERVQGLPHSIVWHHPDPTYMTVDDAKRLSHITYLQYSRHIVASFMMLAQILRAFTLTTMAGREYNELYLAGREPPVKGIGERVVRVCGRASDMTELSVQRYGLHILPVYEQPGRVQHLFRDNPQFRYWCVEKGEYGSMHAWAGLQLDPQSLVRTTTGRRLLVLEADGTRSEQSLGSGDVQPDLTLHDAAKAFRLIQRAVATGMSEHGVLFRTVRVLIADGLSLYKSGGGYALPLRRRVDLTKEVDVFVDSRAPILLELLAWIGRVSQMRTADDDEDKDGATDGELPTGEDADNVQPVRSVAFLDDIVFGGKGGGKRRKAKAKGDTTKDKKDNGTDSDNNKMDTPMDRLALSRFASILFGTSESRHHLCLDTDDPQYFEAVSQLMAAFGFMVVDPSRESPASLASTPYLVYYRETSDTVTAALALLRAKVVDPHRCCVLLDRAEGVRDFAQAAEASDVTVICSAEVHDDVLQQVRSWFRQGYLPHHIQDTLDSKYSRVLDVLSASGDAKSSDGDSGVRRG